MKRTLTTHQIADALKRDENAAWSWEGAKALAEYLEQYEEETETEMELDIVAIRCEFSEYSGPREAAQVYGWEGDADYRTDDEDDLDASAEAALEWLRDRTAVIEFNGGIIIQDF